MEPLKGKYQSLNRSFDYYAVKSAVDGCFKELIEILEEDGWITKDDIKRAIERAELESNQVYLSKQSKEYYNEIIRELKSYYSKSESALDLYRK